MMLQILHESSIIKFWVSTAFGWWSIEVDPVKLDVAAGKVHIARSLDTTCREADRGIADVKDRSRV
jgi:hypothetical protein